MESMWNGHTGCVNADQHWTDLLLEGNCAIQATQIQLYRKSPEFQKNVMAMILEQSHLTCLNRARIANYLLAENGWHALIQSWLQKTQRSHCARFIYQFSHGEEHRLFERRHNVFGPATMSSALEAKSATGKSRIPREIERRSHLRHIVDVFTSFVCHLDWRMYETHSTCNGRAIIECSMTVHVCLPGLHYDVLQEPGGIYRTLERHLDATSRRCRHY